MFESRTFPGKFPKNFNLSGNFTKNFDFPGKNWPFTATSGQIILFLFKNHDLWTYFLFIIRYNNINISRPVHDPPVTTTTPLSKIWGINDPDAGSWICLETNTRPVILLLGLASKCLCDLCRPYTTHSLLCTFDRLDVLAHRLSIASHWVFVVMVHLFENDLSMSVRS